MSILLTLITLTGCSGSGASKERRMHDSAQPHSIPTALSATAAWDELNAVVEQTQSIVGGTWRASDTGARACGEDGAQWVITRLGPGAPEADRRAIIEKIDAQWRAHGWAPMLSDLDGDAPELRLRYPADGSFDNRFFIEIGITVHGSGLQAQTPCAPGDVDALNEERYASRHQSTTTHPGISPAPGASS